MTLVEHLDELRTRIMVCGLVLRVAIGLCFWQNHLLREIANRPVPEGRVPISLAPTEPLPVGTLAATRLGIVTPDQIARNRRYAVLVIAILAMLSTSPDPVTMLVSMGPLYLLFEFSIQLARRFGQPPEGLGGDAEPPEPEAEAEAATRGAT